MQIEKIEISTLVLDPNNARKHDKKNLEAIKGSLLKFGQQKPIVVNDENIVVAGNGTLEAARQLGWTEINIVRTDLEGFNAAAYALADNRTSELAAWDDGVLGSQLLALQTDGFDLASIGFDATDWDEPKEQTEGLTDPDAVPEVENNPYGVQTGDIWLLGNHRVMCGDSTKAEDVERLMDGNIANVMVTDPPYGVKLDQSWRDKALGSKALGKGNKQIVQNDDIADWSNAWEHFKGNVAYIWHAGKYSDVVMNSIRQVGFEICQQLIWNKSIMVMGRSDYHFKHEPCWYAIRKGKTHDWVGDRKQTTVIDAASPNRIMSGSKEEKTEHPTQKPIACMMIAQNHSGDLYEPFCGSGTSVIAAETMGRKCYGMEIDPNYCSVIIKRWEDFTGKKAIKL